MVTLAISVFGYFDSVHRPTCIRARSCRGAECKVHSTSYSSNGVHGGSYIVVTAGVVEHILMHSFKLLFSVSLLVVPLEPVLSLRTPHIFLLRPFSR